MGAERVSWFCFSKGDNPHTFIFGGKQPVVKEKMRDGRSAGAVRGDGR